MAIIVNPSRPSAGYMFGSGFGQALGQGIQDIAQQKLQELNSRQAASRIAKSLEGLGLNSEDAQVFAQLPESQRGPAALDYLQQLAQTQPSQVMQQDQPIQSMQQLQQQAPQSTTESVGQLQELFKGLGRQDQLPGAQPQQQGFNAESFDSILKKLGAQAQINQQQQQAPFGTVPGTAPQRDLPRPPIQQEPQPQPKRPLNAQEFLAQRQATLQQLPSGQLEGETNVQYAKRLQSERKEQEAKEKEAKKEQHLVNKETQAYVDDVDKRAKASEQADKRLGRMETLIDKGSLPIAAFYNQIQDMKESKAFSSIPITGSLLDGVLHLIGRAAESVQKGITSRDTEEFEKLTKDFLREAKDIFGARITDNDLNAFLDTIPKLSMTDAGKKQVIRNIKLFNEANIAEKKAMDSIIKQNGGVRPPDLKARAQTMIKPELDRLADLFINGPTNSLL